MEEKLFKKHDLIIAGAVILLALGALLLFRLMNSDPPAYVTVSVDGVQTDSYRLDRDREVTVTGYDGGQVCFTICDGKVDATSASCPDKICVDHAAISRTGQSIVCLPNRVVISISGSPETDEDLLDAVSQ